MLPKVLEHPIDPAKANEIRAQIAVIEAEHGVRVLYACESGSRGRGFASPDSDYDARFIYVHPLRWYLQVSSQRDVIEVPISGDLDINGWELRKALGLLKKGNATLIEWLASPVVYYADTSFLDALRDIAKQVHQPERSFLHYVHMARKNHRGYLQGDAVRLKKYLYVLRPLLAALWIEQGRGVAPMRFQELVNAIILDIELKQAIELLLTIKRASGESEISQPLSIINTFIETELKRLKSCQLPKTCDNDFSALDHLLMRTVLQMHPSQVISPS